MTKITAGWLTTPHVQRVMSLFSDAGAQAYFVGGCVRNSLMGVPVSDLDIATPVPPQEVMKLAKKANLKAIPTGIDHGTVTVVADGEPFEITTFRKDVETDGRRAVVQFSDKIEDDARRRDFTMNALYATASGQVVDPLGGLTDLNARHVRFIDDADQRIKEDYLRILRFFRFHAWYGDQEDGLSAEGLAACAANLEGLNSLSKERIGTEFVKLLSAPQPERAIGAMDQSGVLSTILPGISTRAFFLLTAMNPEPDPILRLASLGDFDVALQLRLSKAQSKLYGTLRRYAIDMVPLEEIAYRECASTAHSVAILRAALLEQPLAPLPNLLVAEQARFPVTAQDLMPLLSGAALGQALKDLEKSWIDSGFALDRDTLLNRTAGARDDGA